jgi:tRNA-specific 2-thiouridylase
VNTGSRTQKVFVGLSGGVDSSVAALRLVRVGFDVTGVFIKTWHPDFLPCSEADDRLDAMRVAAHLRIPFLTLDAKEEYKRDVADYMIREYRAGRTPNPDVMCNRYVKFGAFLDYARRHDADFVATGHYARVWKAGGGKQNAESGKQNAVSYRLSRGADPEKDQSYFLWTLTQEQLAHALFPIGDTPKAAVRAEAAAAGLPTARKRDSQGICFLGEVDLRDFLSHYIGVQPGNVVDAAGRVIGRHDGALYYTLGQRHGFTVTEETAARTPHYVAAKDAETNVLVVSPTPPKSEMGELTLSDVNEIQPLQDGGEYAAQFRYRQRPVRVRVRIPREGAAPPAPAGPATPSTSMAAHPRAASAFAPTSASMDSYSDVLKNYGITIELLEETDLPSAGQSCVLYRGDECVGGGVIAK